MKITNIDSRQQQRDEFQVPAFELSEVKEILKSLVGQDKASWINKDSQKLAYLAREHQLGPYLYIKLRKADAGTNKSFLEQLRADYAALYSRNLRLSTILKEVYLNLKQAGIKPILLKGPALAETVYDRPDIRPFSDLDLFFREQDWDRARKILLGIGFLPYGRDLQSIQPMLASDTVIFHLALVRDGQSIDIHFDPLQTGLRMKTIENVWQTSITKTIEGVEIPILSPEYQVIHLCVHANRHGYRSILWLLDIYMLLNRNRQEIDWHQVRNIALKEKLEAPVYYTLSFVAELWDLDLSDILALVKPVVITRLAWQATWPKRDVVNFNGVHDGSLVFMEKDIFSKRFFLNLLVTRRLLEKAVYFTRKLFPKYEFLSLKYGTGSQDKSYIYYLMRRYSTFLRRSIK